MDAAAQDLDARIDELKKRVRATSWPICRSIYYGILRSILNGEGKLDQPMNDRYPSIRPTTVRKYMAREGL